MFCGSRLTDAGMSEIERRADAPPLNWSDQGLSELLPTGMVTLLVADVEGSTRLWQTQKANGAAWRHLSVLPKLAALWPAFNAQVALAGGDLSRPAAGPTTPYWWRRAGT
jgi:hypothetical protein